MRVRKWRMGGNAKNFNNRAMHLPPPELRLYRVRLALCKFASYAFLHSRAGMPAYSRRDIYRLAASLFAPARASKR